MVRAKLSQLLNNNRIMLLDVGAKGGSHELNRIRKYSRCHGFEPNPTEAKELVDSDTGYQEYRCFPYALGAEDCEKSLNITRHSSYSSFLDVDRPLYDLHFRLMPQYERFKSLIETTHQEKVPVRRLDSLDYGHIDLLKMDTQGTELDVLRGAEEKLGNHEISVIKSEVSFVGVYKSGALFGDLDAYLRSFGFLFVDCVYSPDVVYEKAAPLQGKSAAYQDEVKFSVGGDAYYVLHPRKLNDDACLRAGLILAEYRYFSFAKHYLQESGLPDQDVEELLVFLARMNMKLRVMRWAKAWVPRKAFYRLSRLLYRGQC